MIKDEEYTGKTVTMVDAEGEKERKTEAEVYGQCKCGLE